jgi:hypothetical protein
MLAQGPQSPQPPPPLSDTPLILVSTPAELEQMVAELGEEREIGVDLEHHALRSFLGLTCLLQISTRTKDFVVDALALRDDLPLLNNVFTHPKILKVSSRLKALLPPSLTSHPSLSLPPGLPRGDERRGVAPA